MASRLAYSLALALVASCTPGAQSDATTLSGQPDLVQAADSPAAGGPRVGARLAEWSGPLPEPEKVGLATPSFGDCCTWTASVWNENYVNAQAWAVPFLLDGDTEARLLLYSAYAWRLTQGSGQGPCTARAVVVGELLLSSGERLVASGRIDLHPPSAQLRMSAVWSRQGEGRLVLSVAGGTWSGPDRARVKVVDDDERLLDPSRRWSLPFALKEGSP